MRGKSWLLVSTFLFLLVGCVSTTTLVSPTLSSEVIPAIVSTMVQVYPTETVIPTIISTPTHHLTLPPVTIPTVIREAPLDIPTPPGNEPVQKVLWLLETNNGCQLPCWWGITPGETSWKQAKQLFETLTHHIDIASSPGITNYSPTIPLPTEVFNVSVAQPVYSVRDGIVDVIRVNVSMGYTAPGYLTQYTIASFLAIHGQPSEVWISTYRAPVQQNDLPFSVVLFYPTLGITALYSDNGEKREDTVRGCPQRHIVGILSLRSPNLDITFQDIRNSSSAFNREYRLLEEVTEINTAMFYEIFRNPDNSICLETPAHLWPSSG